MQSTCPDLINASHEFSRKSGSGQRGPDECLHEMRDCSRNRARYGSFNSVGCRRKVRPWMAAVALMATRPARPRSPATKRGTGVRTQRSGSRPVSRVLCALRRDSHSSRPDVAIGLKQPTRERCGPHHRSPIRSCSGWGLPCRSVARLAVRSCRTVSPLPDPLTGPSAVCSLLHFPSARAAQALPGTLPCGARTFLGVLANDATVRPTPAPILSGPV